MRWKTRKRGRNKGRKRLLRVGLPPMVHDWKTGLDASYALNLLSSYRWGVIRLYRSSLKPAYQDGDLYTIFFLQVFLWPFFKLKFCCDQIKSWKLWARVFFCMKFSASSVVWLYWSRNLNNIIRVERKIMFFPLLSDIYLLNFVSADNYCLCSLFLFRTLSK